jgi:NAD(P)H-flavin reductase
VLPQNWTYIDGGRVTEQVVRGTVPDIARRAGFVSGPPEMVREVSRTLRRLDVASVKTDAFSGY